MGGKRFAYTGSKLAIAGKTSCMPGIPDSYHAAFDEIVARARQLFGIAVKEHLIAPGTFRLPSFTVGALSMIGEQWIVVDIQPQTNRFYPERRELDWEEGVAEAIALLEAYHARQQLAPSPGDVLTAQVIALVGKAGDVTVSTEQAEFSHVISLRPHRSGAVPFRINVTNGFIVVLEGPDLGWWTFGGDYEDDGVNEAFKVIEQLVLRGGTVRSARRSSELLDTAGIRISGPHRDGIKTRRTKSVGYLPYHQSG